MNILAIIAIFSLIIIIHELGHYFAALRAGVQVISFNIGFGPQLFGRNIKGTKYALNLLPLGGAVQLAGLDESLNVRVPADKRYDRKSLAERFRIIFFGSLMNIVLGFLVFVFIYSVIGMPENITTRIAVVIPNTPAVQIGLVKGDQLLSVNGIKGDSKTLVNLIHQTPEGQTIVLAIARGNKILQKKVQPIYNKEQKSSNIGIILEPGNYKRVNIFKAIWLGLGETIGFIKVFALGIIQMFGKFNFQDVSGPVGIIRYSNEVYQYGLVPFLWFFAVLSMNIGLLNLLPLPALDGGRLVFLLFEFIFRRPVSVKLEKYVHLIGFMVLLSLIFLVTYHDILRLFNQ